MSLAVVRRAGTSAAYGVLAHLDLGRDAANLYDATLADVAVPWRDALLAAYAGDPARLGLQFAGLTAEAESVAPLVAALRAGTLGIGSLVAAPATQACFADAIEHWWSCHAAAWQADAARAHAQGQAWLWRHRADLTALRDALWERSGGTPELEIVDVEALGGHGRGRWLDGRRVVATSLAEDPEQDPDPEHALLQVFHEEVHAVTDRFASAGGADTRVGAPGHSAHAQRERVAIEIGEAIVGARRPALASAYARWCARVGH